MLESFYSVTHDGLRLGGGGYRRDHLHAFAQHVEVTDSEVRIVGSKRLRPALYVLDLF
jgi:site-specific DNA recombinase